MRRAVFIGGVIAAAQIFNPSGAVAGPWEDGMASYNRGDYLPAIQMFKPLAAKGNAKAQHVIGVMYEKGQGVARNSVRALAWFSVAAKKGDREAKTKMQEISKTMTPDELSQARAMAVACEASDYRGCGY
jgi:TPR repeat protein